MRSFRGSVGGELAEAGGVEDWVDLDALTTHLASVLWSTSLAWAEGRVDDARFEAQEQLGVAYLMAGVTLGETRDGYVEVIRRTQPRTAQPDDAKVTRLEARR